jgi:hypothetical protein
MAYFVGCVAAAMTLGIIIALKGLFTSGSAGIGIGGAIEMIFFISLTSLLPILLFALPGFVVLTVASVIFGLRNLITQVLGWGLNGAASIAVLGSMGGDITRHENALSLIFVFAISGGVGGAIAWSIRPSTMKDDGEPTT